MLRKEKSKELFSSPFHKAYWKLAALECTYLRSLIVAALFIALRVAVKSFSINLTESLRISVDFLVNSVGSMIYGPLMGLLVGAVSDTLGCLLFPSGAYFFPFIFVEMSSSFVFGLFLYRARITHTRAILSRFSVVFFCNIILNSFIMKWYYIVVLEKDYVLFRLARIIKNVALFPMETLLLIVWLELISRITYSLHLTYAPAEKKKISVREILFLILLTILSVACILLYIFVYLPNKDKINF